MKKKLLLFFLPIFMFSCAESIIEENLIENGEPLVTKAQTSTIYTDLSGDVEVIIVQNSVSGNKNELTVNVPSDYVVIGGGASVSNRGTYGALLTKTFPNTSLTAWTGASSDHIRQQNHTLTVYAVGLKLKNVSRATLRNHIVITTASQTNYPNGGFLINAQAYAPSGYKIIGGGGEVNLMSGDGVLLRSSKPTPSYWGAQAKDHIRTSIADLKAYAICINPNITGFGELEIQQKGDYDYSDRTGAITVSKNVDVGWVPACVGGVSYYSGYGRMLYSLIPGMTMSSSGSDHIRTDTNNSHHVDFIQIRKKP